MDDESEVEVALLGQLNTLKHRHSRYKGCSYSLSCRTVLAIYMLVACMAVYGMRAGLSVAIVAMVNQTFASQTSDHIVHPVECRTSPDNATTNNETGEFNWDQKTQGIILGSFFYGYLTTQLPGGWLACRFGGKRVLGFGVLFTAIFTLLVPVAARLSVYLFIFARILAGLSEGITLPALTVMWTRWAAPEERAKYVTFSSSGCDFGTVLTMMVSGYLCSFTQIDNGWPLVFYVFGAFGILWFIPWMIFVHESPSEHPRVSKEEKSFLQKAVGTTQDKTAKKLPVPWKSILTSPPFAAVCVIFTVHGWGLYVFLTSLPTYFKEVLDFDIKENGLLMAIPFIVAFLFQNISAFLLDRLSERWPRTLLRKLFIVTAFLLAAALLILPGFLSCNQKALSVFLLSISCGALAIYVPVASTNLLDLSPRFAGLLYGLANMFSNVPGVLEPYTVGIFTNQKPTREQWRKVFFVTCALYVFGAVFYAVFGSANTQDWNNTAQHPVRNSDQSLKDPSSVLSESFEKA